jgi:hypothetical protein
VGEVGFSVGKLLIHLSFVEKSRGSGGNKKMVDKILPH